MKCGAASMFSFLPCFIFTPQECFDLIFIFLFYLEFFFFYFFINNSSNFEGIGLLIGMIDTVTFID